jgi:hypothetical protein
MEFGNDDLSWGDVITVFDAWAIPGSFACPDTSVRFYAMDSYPRDTESEVGGSGTLTWGDVITTFDRWTNPVLPRPWRTICDPEVPPTPASVARTALMARDAVQTAVITIADGSGAVGGTARLPVTLSLVEGSADRVAFAVEVMPASAGLPTASASGFDEASGLPAPTITTSPEGGLGVAWLVPIDPALSGVVALGDVLVAIPSDASAGDAWQVRLTAVGASYGPDEIPVTAGPDATATAEDGGPHDVRVRRFSAPRKVKVGDTKRFTVEVENLTETPEQVEVRLLRGGEIQTATSLEVAGGRRARAVVEYTFTPDDRPSVVLTAEAVVAQDDNPEDNSASETVSVR